MATTERRLKEWWEKRLSCDMDILCMNPKAHAYLLSTAILMLQRGMEVKAKIVKCYGPLNKRNKPRNDGRLREIAQ